MDLQSNTELMRLIQSRGIHCSLDPRMDYFAPLTGAGGRVICAEVVQASHPVILPNDGVSFWLHTGSGVAFIGTWTGLTYYVHDNEHLAELANHCLVAARLKSGAAPHVLPPECVDRYGLSACCFYELRWLHRKGAPEVNPEGEHKEYSLESCFSKTLAHFDSWSRVAPESPLIIARAGPAEMLARFYPGMPASVSSLVAITDPPGRYAEGHLRVLSTLIRESDLAVLDSDWGTYVHLDDAYYSESDPSLRPSAPRDAHGHHEP